MIIKRSNIASYSSFLSFLLLSSANYSVMASNYEVATVGAGCYWGTDKFFRKDFQLKYPNSIITAKVGFMGGKIPLKAHEPLSYRQVCSGETGHVEVLQIEYDQSKASYQDLIRFFFTFHDPTTMNRQGNDRGTQYASVIFYHNDEQKRIAENVTKELNDKLSKNDIKFRRSFESNQITTAIKPATDFIPAHEEHQEYLMKNPNGYCNHGIRFEWSD